MLILNASDNNFNESIQKILNRAENVPKEVEETVNKIINDIKLNGDLALINYTQKFDGHDDILITEDELKNARSKVDKNVYDALETAFRRIKFFHEKQISESWKFEQNGEVLGQIISPLERAGIYVPGGKAVYPSSVLMNAIPAIVAGVEEIIMVTPDNGNGVDHKKAHKKTHRKRRRKTHKKRKTKHRRTKHRRTKHRKKHGKKHRKKHGKKHSRTRKRR